MPYIKKERRNSLPANAGELNYHITRLIQHYLLTHANYQGFNDVMGALTGALLELYRRKIAPYEDKKIKENGDVW